MAEWWHLKGENRGISSQVLSYSAIVRGPWCTCGWIREEAGGLLAGLGIKGGDHEVRSP